MNFFISTENNYHNNFNLNYTKIKNFHIYHDAGWIVTKNSLLKVNSQSYCKIEVTNNLKILHNDPREFPVWFDTNCCSTFTKLKNYLPVDGMLTYDNKWHVTYKEKYFETSKKIYNAEQTIDFCIDLLYKKTSEFLKNNKNNLIVFDSNGLDSLLARSVLDFCKAKYELRKITKKPFSILQKHLNSMYWGFNQIELFDKPTTIIGGFYGDEYLLRSPSYIQSLLRDKNIDVVKIFDQIETSYMKRFFEVIYLEKCKKIKKKIAKQKMKEIITNDIQIWHIDTTYIFSPFKDLKFLELLNCDKSVIIKQLTDGWLSKQLISYFNPQLVKKIDKFKNMNDPEWFEY